MLKLLLGSMLALSAAACTRESANGSNTPPPAPAPPPATGVTAPPPVPAATTAAPAPDAGGDTRCADIRARFKTELAKRTDTCAAAADCACYGAEGGGCGGVTDRATADRLEPISAEFHASKCRYEVQCAAWACDPKCVNGRCSQ